MKAGDGRYEPLIAEMRRRVLQAIDSKKMGALRKLKSYRSEMVAVEVGHAMSPCHKPMKLP